MQCTSQHSTTQHSRYTAQYSSYTAQYSQSYRARGGELTGGGNRPPLRA